MWFPWQTNETEAKIQFYLFLNRIIYPPLDSPVRPRIHSLNFTNHKKQHTHSSPIIFPFPRMQPDVKSPVHSCYFLFKNIIGTKTWFSIQFENVFLRGVQHILFFLLFSWLDPSECHPFSLSVCWRLTLAIFFFLEERMRHWQAIWGLDGFSFVY